MPRKRRKSKTRTPSGLMEISPPELIHWAVYGPMIGGHDHPGHTVWPDWETWAEFYGRIRNEYLAGRRHAPVAAERLYEAIVAGNDPDMVYEELERERRENDPRKILGGGK